MNLLDGKVRELGTGRTGLSLRGAGGVYGQDRGRLLLEPLVDTRFQVRSIGMRGDSRVVLDLPARLTGLSGIAVHDSRVAFSETTADSVFVRLAVGPKAPFKTVASFPKDARLELAWSFDGGTLAISDGASSLWFIPVGADGKTPPLPRAARLPFSYFYELFWLPDGSGVTVIAQPNGSPTTHVALVRVADPDRPVLLSRDDSHDKWGHLVSPDGKYVVYESERYVGTTLWAVDLDEALKEATRK
jgi:hypothetical protein